VLLGPSSAAKPAIIALFARLLAPMTSAAADSFPDPSVAAQALEILPAFSELPPDDSEPIFAALDQLVFVCVPRANGAAELPRGDVRRAPYLKLRTALLAALAALAQRGAAAAAGRLMRCSMNAIFWDAKVPRVTDAMRAVAKACWSCKPDAAHAVADAILAVAMEQLTTEHARVKFPRFAFAAALQPLLSRAPAAYLESFFKRNAVMLVKLAGTRPAAPTAAPEDVVLSKRHACFSLMELLYAHCTPASLKLVSAEYERATSGKKMVPIFTKACKTEMQTAEEPMESLRLACRTAAFAAFATMLAATQTAEPKKAPNDGDPPGPSSLETYTAALLRGDFFAGNSWAAVVDCTVAVKCKLVLEARARPLPADAATRQDGSSRAMRLKATVSSTLFSQTMDDEPPPPRKASSGGAVPMDVDTLSTMTPEDAAASTAVEGAEAADDADFEDEAAPEVDILDRGPALDALVRLLEQCTRAFGPVLTAAAASGALPSWMQPLHDALLKTAPLAPPNAALFVAKALLRLQDRTNEAQRVRAEKAAGDKTSEAGAADASSMDASMTLAGTTQAPAWDTELLAAAAPPTAAQTRPLARRGRPKSSLPSLFAPQLAAALIGVFVSDPDASGGCAMHDVLRQTCWAVVDWSAAWTDATAVSYPELGAALGRLIDHAASVTLNGPTAESQKARDANVELVMQLLRCAAVAWPAVAQSHPARTPFAEALIVVGTKAGGRLPLDAVTRRTVALQLLAGLLLRGQPLVAQTDNADELARRIVKVDIPEPSAGANLYGHKRLYTTAGTVLGLELARRAADGTPPGPWVEKLWEKLRALLNAGMPTFDPFIVCLAMLVERFPAAAVQYAPQVVTRLPDAITDSRWEALNVLTAACVPGSVLDCASLWVDLEPRLSRLAAASSDKESDIKLLGALCALFVNNAWPGAEAAAQGCLPLLKSAFLRHRHGSVRRAYFALLRALASAFPAMLQTAHLRESMLGALTDADWTAVQEALAWWDTQAGLRDATLSERLLDMVTSACFAQTADDWPRAAALLLLRLPAHVDALYDEHLLGDKPLDAAATFIAAKIDTQWAGASVPVSDGLQSLAAESLSLYPSSMTMASQFGAGSQVGPSGALSASQQANPAWLRTAPPPKPLRRVFSGGQPAKPGARGPGVYATDKRDAAILAEAQRAGHEVTLTREYRISNFPDITTITRRVLVDALLRVAARDAPAAASALAALAATAWAEKGSSADDTHGKLREALAAALSEPVAPASAFFAAISRVALADAALPGACGLVQHDKLAQAGLRARQPASAALVAEHALLHYAGARDAAARASKRQRAQESALPGLIDVLAAASTAWAALARLLRSSGESDVALVVMQHTAAASTPECDALRAQLEGDAELARDRFDAAIADAERELGGDDEPQDAQQLRADVARWRDARRELLMSMGRWSDVWDELADTLPAEHGGPGMLPMLWARQEHAAEQVVPAYVRAAVRLGHGDQLRALLAGLAQMADQAPRASFEAAFGLELAALEATAWPPADDRARLLLASAARTTRAAWLAAPPSALRIRHALVAGMQPQAELGATVDLVASMRNAPDVAAAPAAAMLARWASHMPSPAFAPPSALETVAAVRELCCDALVAGAAAHGAVAPAAISSLRGELTRAAGDAARRFGALSLSDELLARAPDGFARAKAMLKVCLARVDAASAATLAAEPVLREELLLTPLQALGQPEQELHAPPEAARDVAALRGAFLLRLARLPPPSGEEDCSGLYGAQAFAAMQVATVAARPAEAPRSAARDLLRLAALCNEALMLLEDAAEQGAAPASTGELSMAAARAVVAAAGGEEAAAAAMVDAILRAATLASLPDARAALPRALALLGRHAAVRSAFERLAPAVPLWQLLPWAPQMVSLLGGIEADTVLPVLRSLAEAYPRALHFPLALAAASSAGPLQTRVQALLALAVNPAADRFARAVEDLAFPDDRLRRWHAALVVALRDAAATAPAVRAAVAAMLDDVADPDAARARGAGVLTVDFAASARRKAAEHLGSPVDFSSLTPGKLLKFVQAALEDPGAQRAKMRRQPRRRVETQSVFLAELREDAADAVEVPGQYAAAEARGEPPRPAEHLRVVGVDPVVSVLESLQAPCKLTLRCSDGTEAEFLAKGGEDLRQDERILRLFRCASAALQAHAPAAARGLSVVTFHVEPLSPRCGLVSWLRGAVPIKDVISRILPANLEAHCRDEYAHWAKSKVGGEGGKNTFGELTMTGKASVEDVTKHLDELHASIPPYTLRTAMLQLAGTPERFLAYRARYAATLAASSAVCFVVGLGDRHTGNIMLDENTGALVHIDFGYSFGTASTLPVPEIVPFRLTRCVREAIAPLDRTELLTSDLALALSALHAARGPLSAALEVFAREPLLDWTREAVNVAQKAGITAADAPAAHNARRLATARSKLAYANPVDTALRDLAPSWRSKPANWAALQALVHGDAKRGNVRAAVCDRDTSGPNGVTPFCADAREQAACLVDLATDANVLGRCWVGWRPWL
jgi:DNA-dependent protein kinase catalytic subunit